MIVDYTIGVAKRRIIPHATMPVLLDFTSNGNGKGHAHPELVAL
jgi:hypothetical protein